MNLESHWMIILYDWEKCKIITLIEMATIRMKRNDSNCLERPIKNLIHATVRALTTNLSDQSIDYSICLFSMLSIIITITIIIASISTLLFSSYRFKLYEDWRKSKRTKHKRIESLTINVEWSRRETNKKFQILLFDSFWLMFIFLLSIVVVVFVVVIVLDDVWCLESFGLSVNNSLRTP